MKFGKKDIENLKKLEGYFQSFIAYHRSLSSGSEISGQHKIWKLICESGSTGRTLLIAGYLVKVKQLQYLTIYCAHLLMEFLENEVSFCLFFSNL